MVLKGNAVSAGVALGAAYVYKAFALDVHEAYCEGGTETAEKARFDTALRAAGQELEAVIASFAKENADKAKIFAAHMEILNDEEIVEMVEDAILHERKLAEYAVMEAFAEFIELLSRAEDPLIAARVADLRDVRNRLIRVLQGEPEKNLSTLAGPVVVVAHDLLPSDTATLDRKNVLGIVTEVGGATSHSAIIANSYRIPAVLGVPGCTEILTDGTPVGLDALAGEVYVQPGDEAEKALEAKRATWLEKLAEEDAYLAREPLMADGTRLEMGINIGSAERVADYDHCDFVGLLRTEFLYMQSDHMPTEEEQYNAYRRVLEHAGGKPVTLRTLDIGGDKTLSYMQLPREDNPFLGKRALRLCFEEPQLFRTQLRAALRAAVAGPLWLMLPMVGSLEDIRRGRAFFEEAKVELEAQGVPHGQDVRFGIMVEIPAIAAVADLAADEVDFASIGTNDLCQYLCAVDRMNPELDAYYQCFSPAMVRTLGGIIEAFDQKGKPVSVCGELAGDARGAVLLAGLGLKKLSMSPAKLAGVKAALSRVGLKEARALAQKARGMRTEKEVLALFEN